MSQSNYLFSPSTLSFYPVVLLDSYKSAGTLPDDVIEVDDSTFNEYSGYKAGFVRGFDDKGNIAWVAEPEPSDEIIISMAEDRRSSLLSEAAVAIQIWQVKLLAGRKLTDDQKSSLNKWLDYIDLLETVDITTADAARSITWPSKPE